MLVDDPVKRVDNMTMAWGLEARVPFLDHELVELALRIPSSLKVRNGGKYVLKEAARKLVPDAVIDRPKGYFPVPALKYLRGPFLALVRNILNEPAARRRELFRRDYVDNLLANPETTLTRSAIQNSGRWHCSNSGCKHTACVQGIEGSSAARGISAAHDQDKSPQPRAGRSVDVSSAQRTSGSVRAIDSLPILSASSCSFSAKAFLSDPSMTKIVAIQETTMLVKNSPSITIRPTWGEVRRSM
jgi:hypothetical protein